MWVASEVNHAIPATWAREMKYFFILCLVPHQQLFALQLLA
jgi:hypothetical protein